MKIREIADAGFLIALLNKGDSNHAWAAANWPVLAFPLHTCEAALTEAFHLLRRAPGGDNKLVELMQRGALKVSFSLQAELTRTFEIMSAYVNVPASLADACLVRMAELNPDARVITCDRDFFIYRTSSGKPIPTLTPHG